MDFTAWRFIFNARHHSEIELRNTQICYRLHKNRKNVIHADGG